MFMARRLGTALMTIGLLATTIAAMHGTSNLAALLAVGVGALLITIHPDRSTK